MVVLDDKHAVIIVCVCVSVCVCVCRDVGFLRKTSTALYFSVKPWLFMGAVVYSGVWLTGYKVRREHEMEHQAHGDDVEEHHH